jgi:hypothetical protein
MTLKAPPFTPARACTKATRVAKATAARRVGQRGGGRMKMKLRARREPHLGAMKRILQYIQCTLDLGFHLYQTSPTDLTVYTDANWAGCLDTRKSRSGYALFMGDNLIS